MTRTKIFIALSTVLALGACAGTGGGAGGGTGGSGSTPGGSFDANFDAAIAEGPTTDLPVSGRANYEGEVEVALPGSTLAQSTDVAVTGDVTLEIDFAAGNASTLDGIAQNFEATLTDGSTAAIGGFLLVTPTGSQLQRTTLPAPVSGTTGTLSALYEGQLTFNGTQANVDLTLQGPALGAGASSFAGAANMAVDFPAGAGTDVLGTGGQFYLKRQ